MHRPQFTVHAYVLMANRLTTLGVCKPSWIWRTCEKEDVSAKNQAT